MQIFRADFVEALFQVTSDAVFTCEARGELQQCHFFAGCGLVGAAVSLHEELVDSLVLMRRIVGRRSASKRVDAVE